MGGEGHVFDMIRRTKQNRKMLQERRFATKLLSKPGKTMKKYIGYIS